MSLARYAFWPYHLFSDTSLTVLSFFLSTQLFVDIEGDCGRLLDDRLHDRAHS